MFALYGGCFTAGSYKTWTLLGKEVFYLKPFIKIIIKHSNMFCVKSYFLSVGNLMFCFIKM